MCAGASLGGIHQSIFDEKLEMISSLDFLQFTIHNHDSGKSTTQKHDPEILTESCFCLAGILNLNENVKSVVGKLLLQSS
jgi:hypothetical protein